MVLLIGLIWQRRLWMGYKCKIFSYTAEKNFSDCHQLLSFFPILSQSTWDETRKRENWFYACYQSYFTTKCYQFEITLPILPWYSIIQVVSLFYGLTSRLIVVGSPLMLCIAITVFSNGSVSGIIDTMGWVVMSDFWESYRMGSLYWSWVHFCTWQTLLTGFNRKEDTVYYLI